MVSGLVFRLRGDHPGEEHGRDVPLMLVVGDHRDRLAVALDDDASFGIVAGRMEGDPVSDPEQPDLYLLHLELAHLLGDDAESNRSRDQPE
jgi:hypothetical protein